jgi:hypothetical protein
LTLTGTSKDGVDVDVVEPSVSADNNNSHNSNNGHEITEVAVQASNNTKPTVRRVGGRSLSRQRNNQDTAPSNRTNILGVLPAWLVWAAAALAVSMWLLSQTMWGVPKTNYVYYQSSYYESRIVGVDGKVETSRKESVRTNIPSLMEDGAEGDQRIPLRQVQALDREIEAELKANWDDFTLF